MKIPFFSWLFLLPICSLFVNFGIFVLSGQCLHDQRDLLIGLKTNLIFDNNSSTKLVHWNESLNCCLWKGVTCSEDGRVIGLNLNNESIYDGLHKSSSLFTLHWLVTLDLSTLSYLSDNMLKLEDPNLAKLVQNLSEIKELYLDGVNISAPGNEWCQALSSSVPNLRVLSLSDCHLSGPFNSSLSKLQSLSIIRLDSNPFNAPVPEFFVNFTNLTSLHLGFCGLNGTFPEKVFQILTLQTLDLSNNELLQGALPDSIGNLAMFMAKNLTEINLSHNDLTGKIHSLIWKDLPKLVNLDLGYNSLGGNIPASLSSLPSLQILGLSNNQFSGRLEFNVPSTLLITLDLSSNNLEGPVPTSVFELQGPKFLSLSSDNFSGPFQLNKIQQLRNLSNLDLSFNSLSVEYIETNSLLSSFPQITTLRLASCNWIWKLNNLLNLNLSDNLLEGPLHNLSSTLSLSILDLSSNLLQGQLPTLPPSAAYLDLSRNNFSSVMPGIGSPLSVAYFLSLSNNQLSGSIPVSICGAIYLEVLDLSDNLLSGAIPQCFYEMGETLWVLDVRRNKLSGNISDSFSVNCGLRTLNLNGNQLGGVVPKSLENCKNLEVLDMGNNQLKDALPCNLKSISSLRVLILRSNQFYGSIDFTTKGFDIELVKILTIFTAIDISNNNLDGPIPEEIGKLKSLVVLNLSHNALTGHIPPFLGNLTQLESLDLSSNKLTGEIPVQLTDLTFLSVLNFSFNLLVGPIPQVKQFGTFTNDSYIHNKELCGFPLTTHCISYEAPPPTFQETHSNSGEIDLNFLSVELGFIFGFGIVIGPLMFWKRWSRRYFKHVDDILIRVFPQLNLGIKYRRRAARINQGQRH
ncbi:hypothetical protein RGQ29_025537 [Quercus rubra]|uniref:Leucine-rich repeat-containing N-terminal plant-type domain-containing protein n=1 Tax=Quercus rubra TaxID=3512 RepID=A0AAN7EY50_QUERU|nr:hypothetical protein RGQ29_025537 [Quercus rubra]